MKWEDIPTDDSWMKRTELYANHKEFYEINLDIWIKILQKLRTQKLIKLHEETLERNEKLLAENPNNLFYKGMVKNTKELIEELKE